MRKILALLYFAFATSAFSQQPTFTAEQIMARVAANQDASLSARSHFVYTQHARVTSRKGNTVRCDEITDTRITPTENGQKQTLLTLQGRVLYRGKYVTYNSLAGPAEASAADTNDGELSARSARQKIDDDTSTDRNLVENMRNNLTDAKSKDGLGKGLFPLTSSNQRDMDFRLVGREVKNGRDTFHITFQPKSKDDYGWKGDAWIDATAFQPVVVRTAMSKKLPFAVRALMGINLPGLGFTATFAPQPTPRADDPEATKPLWFPESFGTEFKLKILFFFSREIVVSVANRDFEQTHTAVKLLDSTPIASPAEGKP